MTQKEEVFSEKGKDVFQGLIKLFKKIDKKKSGRKEQFLLNICVMYIRQYGSEDMPITLQIKKDPRLYTCASIVDCFKEVFKGYEERQLGKYNAYRANWQRIYANYLTDEERPQTIDM